MCELDKVLKNVIDKKLIYHQKYIALMMCIGVCGQGNSRGESVLLIVKNV